MPSVSVDRLQSGMFISLESIGWMDHPFLLNRFRITGPKQIETLRRMGLKSVDWDPERSTSAPLPEVAKSVSAEEIEVEVEIDMTAGALEAMMQNKRERVSQVREKRESMARCARLFEREVGQIREIFEEVVARPIDAQKHSRVMVDRLVGGLVKANSVAVHLVNLKNKLDTGAPNHAMNVMVVSLLIGKALGLAEEDLKLLGLGAMLHDVGLTDVPSRVQRNPNRSAAEEKFYRAHTGFGLKVVAPMRDLPVPVKNVIACHHENWDGKGYPNGLAGAKIPKLARIVAIANRYDNLCNPLDPKGTRPPAEAVSYMFKHENGCYDPEVLGAFVKALGVYPPGTFVRLADGTYGLVIETNSRDLLRPVLMLYDASVPRSEALLLDTKESDEKIAEAVSPRDVPREAIEYLAPQGRVDFYLEGTN